MEVKYADRLERLRLARGKDRPGPSEYAQEVVCLADRGKALGLPCVGRCLAERAHYVAMRLDGSSHQLAEMLALQTPPMSNTDREFLEGHANGSQFQDTPWVGDLYQGVAREAGVDTKGKVYLSGLARYQGDPEAWVTGRGDVQRVLEKRGWGAEGSVNVKPTQAKQLSKATHLADDLVDGEVSRVLQTVPESERPYVDVQDLRDQVVQTRKPHWSSSE